MVLNDAECGVCRMIVGKDDLQRGIGLLKPRFDGLLDESLLIKRIYDEGDEWAFRRSVGARLNSLARVAHGAFLSMSHL